jgi:hypothetical protein
MAGLAGHGKKAKDFIKADSKPKKRPRLGEKQKRPKNN